MQINVALLGHGLIMPKPEAGGSEFKHGEDVGGVLFITRGDTAAMFDLVEEPLDAVALAIEHGAEAGAPASGDFGGNVRRGASRRYAAAEPICIVGFVSQQDRSLAQTAKQLDGSRAIGGLARREDQLQRQAVRVGEYVDLGRQSSSAAAHTPVSTASFCVRGMLMHPHGRAVDHLHIGIVDSSDRLH